MDELTRWLTLQGFGAYAASFKAQKVDLVLLAQLTEADLKELGVAAFGDRKRLMKAIASLEATSGLQATSNLEAAASSTASSVRSGGRSAPAERRQLTVMFSDLVDSTRLAARLDPEDWCEVLRAYQDAVAAVVVRYGGHVAQFLGDGALVYFGYPRAHEDDADRAARASLEAVKAVAALSPHGTRLAARIGIATGQVVVGEIGAGTTAADQSASGDTPNLAARLQAQAQPGEIVLSSQTQNLLGGAFATERVGRVQLKGLAAPVEVWRLIGERVLASRFESRRVTKLSPLVGRDSELALLRERLEVARKGEGQTMLLCGEAGIGKSRVCLSLRGEAAATGCTTVVWQCSPYLGGGALFPVAQELRRLAAIEAGDTLQAAAAKIDAALARAGAALPAGTSVRLVRAIGLDEGSIPKDGSRRQNAVQTKRQSLDVLLETLLALARAHAVLLLVEDAHWIDPTTEELIGQLNERIRGARLLMLITARPEYLPTCDSLQHLMRLNLGRLDPGQCSALIDSIARKPLPAEVRAEIIARTDGIPLFIEELTRTVLESGLLQEAVDAYGLKGPLRSAAIPSTLQDSLMARLDRLSLNKQVAQAAAVIGREFSYRLLAAVLRLPQKRLDKAVEELEQSGLVVRQGLKPEATYSFKHALVRDTAYNSMLKSQRVVRHRQVAAAIEQVAPEIVSAQPELLALHYQEGARPAQAFHYFELAGQSALRRSNCPEAVIHLKAALALIPQYAKSLPNGHLRQSELKLQLELGGALMQTAGFGAASTLAAHARAREIALTLPDFDIRIEACRRLGGALIAKGRCREVIQMFEKFDVSGCDVPQTVNLASPNLASREFVVGAAYALLGELREADAILSAAMQALGEPKASRHERLGTTDLRAAILMWHAVVHCQRGLLERSEAAIEEALSIGVRLNHGITRAGALGRMGWIALIKGDISAAMQFGKKALEVSEQFGLTPWAARGQIVIGQAQLANSAGEEGLHLVRRAIDSIANGAPTQATGLASEIAETLLMVGRDQDAAEFVAIGERLQSETEDRLHEAELIRQRGLLCERKADLEAAEAQYRRAAEIAASRGALLFQLRAAIALRRVTQARGEEAEAVELLRSTYKQFSEGFEFADLARAREALGTPPDHRALALV